MLDRLTSVFTRASAHGGADTEHLAALEAVLLVIYADRTVRQAELDALEAIDESRPDWTSDTFTVSQYLGPATAAVREAIDGPDGGEALLRSIAERITTPALRADLPELCRAVAGADGEVSPPEQAVIDRIVAYLG